MGSFLDGILKMVKGDTNRVDMIENVDKIDIIKEEDKAIGDECVKEEEVMTTVSTQPRVFTVEDRARAVELRDSGMTLKQVSEIIGTSIFTVSEWYQIAKNGYSNRSASNPNKKRRGVAKTVATKKLKTSGRNPFDTEMRDACIKLVENGVPYQTVADGAKISKSTVESWVREKHGTCKLKVVRAGVEPNATVATKPVMTMTKKNSEAISRSMANYVPSPSTKSIVAEGINKEFRGAKITFGGATNKYVEDVMKRVAGGK